MELMEDGFLSAYALSKGGIEVAEGDDFIYLKLWQENRIYYVKSLRADNSAEGEFRISKDFTELTEAKRFFLETIDDMGLQRQEPLY